MTYTEDTIRQLIDRFMAGETSLEEEETIGKWLSSHPNMSDDLKDYQQMFAYFDEGMPQKAHHRKLWFILSAAASLALLITLSIPAVRSDQHPKDHPNIALQKEDYSHEEDERLPENNKDIEESTDSIAISPQNAKERRENLNSKRRRYHKYQNSPAPPIRLYAEAEEMVDSLMQSTRDVDYLVDAQLQKQKEEEEEILNLIFLYTAKQEIEANSIIDRLSSQNMDDE